MPRRSDEKDIQLPSDPNNITPPTDRRKCGAERVSFGGEGFVSVPSPVMEKNSGSRDGPRSRAVCVQPM